MPYATTHTLNIVIFAVRGYSRRTEAHYSVPGSLHSYPTGDKFIELLSLGSAGQGQAIVGGCG